MEENKTNKVTYSFAEISQCSRISNTSKNRHAHQQIATVCRQRQLCTNPSDSRKRISAMENLRNQNISDHKNQALPSSYYNKYKEKGTLVTPSAGDRQTDPFLFQLLQNFFHLSFLHHQLAHYWHFLGSHYHHHSGKMTGQIPNHVLGNETA